jgi:APA family basic amino acid/polyamine antiporter
VAATHLLGEGGGRFVSLLIALGLVSTASANLLTGPRVYEAMGGRYPRLAWLSLRRAGGGPVCAIALQSILALGMLFSASFETLMAYIGVTLSLSAATTVLGLFVLRNREPSLPRPYRVVGYPYTPLVFLILESWMIGHALWKQPVAAAWTLGTLLCGAVLYIVVGREARTSPEASLPPN